MTTSDGGRQARRGLRLPGSWFSWFAALLVVLGVLAVPIAWAGDRFADVPNSNPHHDDINTIARAGVTQGCNPPTNNLYCPGDSVTRQQMGTFLARTMRTVTPHLRSTIGSGALDPDASPVVCQTAPFTPTLAIRAFIWGMVALEQASVGELGYSVQPVFSTDGGATWNGSPQIISLATSGTSGFWSNASQTLLLIHQAGAEVRLGLRVARESGTADASDSHCRVQAEFTYADAGLPSWAP